MEVSITQFRNNIFDLVNQALAGTEVWVTHKGTRFKIVPEKTSKGRFSRMTALDFINRESGDLNDKPWQEEMERKWEEDWSTL